METVILVVFEVKQISQKLVSISESFHATRPGSPVDRPTGDPVRRPHGADAFPLIRRSATPVAVFDPASMFCSFTVSRVCPPVARNTSMNGASNELEA